MNKTDLVLMALAKCELAEDDQERKNAKDELRMAVLGYEQVRRDPEVITMDLLAEIGAPDHLIGYNYVLRAVQMVLEDRSAINHITKELYPRLAAEFHTTASRIERGIRNVIERAWKTGDINAIDRYFGNIVDPEKGKPTCGEFIARIANIIRLEMRK